MFPLDIVMPYYGPPQLLLRAVASVRDLRGTAWRLTIVEDLHPDGEKTAATIRDLADHRIRYLRNPVNLGVAANTFRCMTLAEQKYFVLMDYDDVMMPNYGQAVSALFERYPSAVMAQPGVAVIDEEDRVHRPLPDRIKLHAGPLNRDVELAGDKAAASLLRGNWTYAAAICYRTAATRLLRQRPNTDAVHDLARMIDLILDGGSLAVGSEIAFQYRRHTNSHSSVGARTGERFIQERHYYRQIALELREVGWRSARSAARIRLFSRLNALTQLPGALAHGNGAMARMLVTHALS